LHIESAAVQVATPSISTLRQTWLGTKFRIFVLVPGNESDTPGFAFDTPRGAGTQVWNP